MRNLWILLVAILLVGTLACGSDNAEKSPSASMPSKEPIESIIITIGNLTDKTGPSANAMSIIDKALADVVQYYNDQDLIPGVSLEIQEYDGRYDPSADIPGYIWLKENGADLIWTGAPATPTTLESRVNEDQILLFTPGPSREAPVCGVAPFGKGEGPSRQGAPCGQALSNSLHPRLSPGRSTRNRFRKLF